MAFIERFLGRLFINYKGRDEHLICNNIEISKIPSTINLFSNDFKESEKIPTICTADPEGGLNLSPELNWNNVPDKTKELLIVMEDPDAPLPKPIIHMVCCGVSPEISSIEQGELVLESNKRGFKFLPAGPFGMFTGYRGPRPIRQHGPHRYLFEIYALSDVINTHEVEITKNREELIKLLSKKSIAKGIITGNYERF